LYKEKEGFFFLHGLRATGLYNGKSPFTLQDMSLHRVYLRSFDRFKRRFPSRESIEKNLFVHISDKEWLLGSIEMLLSTINTFTM